MNKSTDTESTDPINLGRGIQGDENRRQRCTRCGPPPWADSDLLPHRDGICADTAGQHTQEPKAGVANTPLCFLEPPNKHLSRLLSNRGRTLVSTSSEQRLRNHPGKQAMVSLGPCASPSCHSCRSVSPGREALLQWSVGTGLRGAPPTPGLPLPLPLLDSWILASGVYGGTFTAGGERRPGARLDLCPGEALYSLCAQHNAPVTRPHR